MDANTARYQVHKLHMHIGVRKHKLGPSSKTNKKKELAVSLANDSNKFLYAVCVSQTLAQPLEHITTALNQDLPDPAHQF